jgi:hypothetical protein
MSAVEGFLLGDGSAQGTPFLPRAVVFVFACGGDFVAFAFDCYGVWLARTPAMLVHLR